jgi:hypothetical protein
VALGVTSNSVARWERGEIAIRPPIARLVRHVVAANAPATVRRPRARRVG